MTQREVEVAKYEACYRSPDYRMGTARRRHIFSTLDRLERGSLLDVGTGRGETLGMAEALGFKPVIGTEAVSYLCDDLRVIHALGHALPFQDSSFDYVTMFDVLEHLLPDDTGIVLRELCRVAKRSVLLTVCNRPSRFQHGDTPLELHINLRKDYGAWHNEISEHVGLPVTALGNSGSISELFRIDIAPR